MSSRTNEIISKIAYEPLTDTFSMIKDWSKQIKQLPSITDTDVKAWLYFLECIQEFAFLTHHITLIKNECPEQ